MCWCLVGRLNPGVLVLNPGVLVVGRLNPGVLVFGWKVKLRCVGVWFEG